MHRATEYLGLLFYISERLLVNHKQITMIKSQINHKSQDPNLGNKAELI